MPTRPQLLADIQQCKVLLSLLHEKLSRLEAELYGAESPASSESISQSIPGTLDSGQGGTSPIPNNTHLGEVMIHTALDSSTLSESMSNLGRKSMHPGFSEYHLSLLSPAPAGSDTPPIPNLPADTGVKLFAILKRCERMMQYKVAWGAARILLYLYAHPGQRSGNEVLGTVAGFSVSGASKHMNKLLAGGLVVRRGWQVFLLTEKALGYIREAAGL